jgi:hypothetical protein
MTAFVPTLFRKDGMAKIEKSISKCCGKVLRRLEAE